MENAGIFTVKDRSRHYTLSHEEKIWLYGCPRFSIFVFPTIFEIQKFCTCVSDENHHENDENSYIFVRRFNILFN